MSPAQNGQHPDIKPRSRDVTDGLETHRRPRHAARGRHGRRRLGQAADRRRVVVERDHAVQPARSTGSRRRRRRACTPRGGYPLEFGTISVSDGISMGHEGMHFSLVSREVIADSVETVMQAERLDGSVLLAGCDKSLPGMLMAAARLDLAAVFLYAGSTLPGRASDGTERTSRSSTRSRRSARAPRGLITREDVDAHRARDLPGRGRLRRHVHRQHDGLAPPRRSGMSLPGSAAPPAVDRRRDGFARRVRRGGRRAAARGITDARHPHPRGVRERDRGRHGARRLDQRRAAPARDRARGRGRPDARRLQPHRRPGPAPRRRQAVRPLRHERRRPHRRRSRSS